MQLAGKVALVTGGSRGIGAAIARALAGEGALVVVNYFHHPQEAEAVARNIEAGGGKALAVKGDVRHRMGILQLAQDILRDVGPVEILVNNAGGGYRFDLDGRKRLSELAWHDYLEQIEASVKGAFNLCQAFAPTMIRRRGGRIINLVASLVAPPKVAFHEFSVAKQALLGFTRGLAAELGPYGITVNTVGPGLVEGTEASKAMPEEARREMVARTPLGRLAQPEDVAGAVVFFASDGAAFVTGQYLAVDGGLAMA